MPHTLSKALASSTLLATLLLGCPRPEPKPDLDSPGIWAGCAEGCPVIHPVPPGSYLQGTPGAVDPSQGNPTRTVTLAHSIAISPEVTRAQFAKFVAETHYATTGGCTVASPRPEGYQYQESTTSSWQEPWLPGPLQTSDDPVTCVSWFDARAYLDWLRSISGAPFRLLSEAEWEYVAHGGTTGRYYWPASDPTAYCDNANAEGTPAFTVVWAPIAVGGQLRPNPCHDKFPGTAPVGSMSWNRFQASDMLGNVEEWVEDCYTPSYDLVATDGSAFELLAPVKLGEVPRRCGDRSTRGGSWKDAITVMGIPMRGHAPPAERTNYRGFRIALSCEAVPGVCTDQAGLPFP